MMVYLVSAYTCHESNDVIATFVLERDARAFAKQCKDHDAKQPVCPELDASDEAWALYDRKRKNWEKRHPAKRSYTCDDYLVSSIRLRPPVMAKDAV
jgi:hypothetical protein